MNTGQDQSGKLYEKEEVSFLCLFISWEVKFEIQVLVGQITNWRKNEEFGRLVKGNNQIF